MATIRHNFKRTFFKTGDVIFREGRIADNMYLVRSGLVEIYTGEKDKKKILTIVGANGLFGEMAIIDDKPRSGTAVALEPTECYVFPKAEVSRRIEKMDPFMKGMLRLLVDALRRANKK
jgi:CRP-like cAMP-binding protein